eukprot:166454-Rhodomonas_salina.2
MGSMYAPFVVALEAGIRIYRYQRGGFLRALRRGSRGSGCTCSGTRGPRSGAAARGRPAAPLRGRTAPCRTCGTQGQYRASEGGTGTETVVEKSTEGEGRAWRVEKGSGQQYDEQPVSLPCQRGGSVG